MNSIAPCDHRWVGEPVCPICEPQDEVEQDRRGDDLERLVDALPESSRILLALVARGVTHRAIAAHYKVHRSTVSYTVSYLRGVLATLYKLGYLELPVHPDPLVRAYLGHLSATRAARALGVDRGRVRRAVARETKRCIRSDSPSDQRLLKVLQGVARLHVYGLGR